VTELVILAGIVIGIYGLSQLLKPPIRQTMHPRLALLILVAGLALAYFGTWLSGETDAVQKIREGGLAEPPPDIRLFRRGTE
jgi:hypothetical protein